MKELSGEDMALCVAYVDGLLPEARRLEFELRLAEDRELARRVAELLSTDELLRRAAAERTPVLDSARRWKPWIWAASLAAAAGILAAIALHLTSGDGGAPRTLIAVAPGFESAARCIDSFPELAGLRPEGVDRLRGESESANVELASFLEKAKAAEAALRGSDEVEAGYFVVPIELGASAECVVLAVDAHGKALALLPAAGEAPPRLEAGRHTLPSPRFALDGERVIYRRGFLVPLGAGRLDVLVGVRTAREVVDFDANALLAESSADGVARRLADAGFEVRRVAVREPPE